MPRKARVTGLTIVLFFFMALPAGAWPVPDTGQTQCYTPDVTSGAWIEGTCPAPGKDLYGQDGNYLINPPSFTKLDENGNDLSDDATEWVMVRDNVTGLIWGVKQNEDGVKNYSNPHDADNTYTWYDSNPKTNGGYAGTQDDYGRDTEGFINKLNGLNFGGNKDWRMPTTKELQTIVNYGRILPASFEDYFPNVQSPKYWSATTNAGHTNNAWLVYMSGGVDFNNKAKYYYVWPVRAGQNRSLDNLVINGDGTVTDPNTGLMWQQENDGIERSWIGALDYAENLTLAHYDDWRLPTIKELFSIVDLTKHFPAVDNAFGGFISSEYWSATTGAPRAELAWVIDMNYGSMGCNYKTNNNYVWPIRAGQNRVLGHLFISSPIQGSKWTRDDVMRIAWDTAGIGGNVRIELSRDGGKTYATIAEDEPNDGSFDWTVTGPGSVNCMLQIVPLDKPAKKTIQGLFSIYPIPFTLTYAKESKVGRPESAGMR